MSIRYIKAKVIQNAKIVEINEMVSQKINLPLAISLDSK